MGERNLTRRNARRAASVAAARQLPRPTCPCGRGPAMSSTLSTPGSAGRCARCNNAFARARLRAEFIAACGGACHCCGETTPAFLTLDHLNNDGSADREGGDVGSYKLMRRLRAAGWPQDAPYAVACFNCNTGRHINGGICPHKESPTA